MPQKGTSRMSHGECNGDRGSEAGGTEGHLAQLAGVTAIQLPAATEGKREQIS